MSLRGTGRRRTLRAALIPLCVGLAAYLCCDLSWAQPPDPALKNRRTDVVNALRNKTIPGGEEQLFDDFFNKFLFAEFLQPETRNNLPKFRRDLKALFFMQGKSGPAHARLRYLTLEKMKEILKTQGLDDVVKINAILIVGDLNEREQEGLSKPKPDADGFKILLAVVTAKSPKTNKPIFSDAMRIAALVGLLRHAEHGSLDPKAAASLSTAMLDIVKQQAPAGVQPDEGRAWMRMRAAEILGALRDSGPNGATAQAIAQALADPNEPLFMRREMARALGKLRYPAELKMNGASAANELGHLAQDICRDELDRFATTQLDARAKAAAGDIPSHRRLRHELYAVRTGLAGVKSLPAGGADAGFADEVSAAVQKLVETSEGSLKGPELATQLETDLEALAKLLRKRAVESPALAAPKLSDKSQDAPGQDEPQRDTRAERPGAIPAADAKQ